MAGAGYCIVRYYFRLLHIVQVESCSDRDTGAKGDNIIFLATKARGAVVIIIIIVNCDAYRYREDV